MFRIDPKLPAEHMKTYAISAPISTHHRKATCREVDCEAWRYGWKTLLDVTTDIGVRQAKYITGTSGRAHTVLNKGTTLEFTFPPGQQCFAAHTVPLEREPLYVVRGGDFRGNPRGTAPRQLLAPHWVDDFANHQDTIATALGDG